MTKERWSAHIREALAQVEEQRDDAVVYLSAIKLVLDVVARGHGPRQCGQEIAEALLQQLALETCAVALQEESDAELVLAGFATQSQRLGGPRGGLGEAGWLALARLVRPGVEPSCFRRLRDGSFEAVAATELAGEGFCVLPFAVGGEAGGALVLHSLVTPAQAFARARALSLVAENVGQALTIAYVRTSAERLSGDLEGELGVTRRALSQQQASLRSQDENIKTLTQALIRSNRVKREFLSTVSHELRTPLNAILGFATLVRDGAAGAVNDEQAELLDRVLTNSQSLNALIDDILFFVQVEADRVAVRRERVVVAQLVDDVVGTLPPPPERDRVPCEVDVVPGAAVLLVDRGLLRRLLFHLLGNAFKFTAAGAVTVRVQAGDERGAVVISVRDTGVGIPADKLKRVFDLFAQGDGSSTRRYNGLGMGLALVERCVRLLGGEISVDSRPGAGSEFRVYLPDALAPAEEPRGGRALTVH